MAKILSNPKLKCYWNIWSKLKSLVIKTQLQTIKDVLWIKISVEWLISNKLSIIQNCILKLTNALKAIVLAGDSDQYVL